LKYNDSNSPKVRACIEKELKDVKDRVLIQYLYSIDTQSQEEQEKEPEEEKESPRLLWIYIFTNNPGMVEVDFCKKLIEKFGYKRAKTVLYNLRKNNFHSVKSMEESLDDNGNIRPRDKNILKLREQLAMSQQKRNSVIAP